MPTKSETSLVVGQRGGGDGLVGAFLCLAMGITLLLTGLNERASGESIVRERDKPTHVAKATGATAREFKARVWVQLGGGGVLLLASAGIVFFSLRSPLGREDSPDDET